MSREIVDNGKTSANFAGKQERSTGVISKEMLLNDSSVLSYSATRKPAHFVEESSPAQL